MLFTSGMEKRFWAEAAATAVKLLNMCPSSSINGDTPDFRWYGEHDNYSQLKVFGCKAFAHLRQSKLDARALRCVMLGYQPGVKGYRLWCIEPGMKKIVVSGDVVFSENSMPFKQVEKDGQSQEKTMKDQVESSTELEVEHPVVEQESNVDNHEISDEGCDDDGQDNLRDYQLARERVRRRDIIRPARYVDSEMLYFALCVAEQVIFSEPESYNEAMKCKERDRWLKAMIEEIESLIKNDTWILVDKVEGRKVISCKWIFKKKLESADNEKVRFKARLVARGFTQKEGVDYNEVFSPVVKHTSIRVLLAVVAKMD